MSDVKKKTIESAVLGWWSSRIDADTGLARKTRAQLRRASRLSEVLVIEATHDLFARLRSVNENLDLSSERLPHRLALIATVVAGMDTHGKDSLPSRFGQSNGDRPVLSPLRFQRILSATDDWVLASRLRRASLQVKRNANIAQLGRDLFYWGESVQNRWCFEYFKTVAPKALSDDQPTVNIEVTAP